MIPGFHRPSEGSVLYRAGGTVVLCTASVDAKVPAVPRGQREGLARRPSTRCTRARTPAARSARRTSGNGRGKPPSGRTQEYPAARRARAARGGRRWSSSASGRSRSTATCSRPTAARARRPSPAASSRWRWRSRSLEGRRLEGARPARAGRRDERRLRRGDGLALDPLYLEDSAARVDSSTWSRRRRGDRRGPGDGGRGESRAPTIDAMVDSRAQGDRRAGRSSARCSATRGSTSPPCAREVGTLARSSRVIRSPRGDTPRPRESLARRRDVEPRQARGAARAARRAAACACTRSTRRARSRRRSSRTARRSRTTR